MAGRVMIMAGGTGGHVFPALAVAGELRRRGWQLCWLGTRNSFEARQVPNEGIAMEWIDIQGMRGKGLWQKLLTPLRLLRAMWQAAAAIRRQRSDVVLGMGGFVSGPGGLVARLLGKPLVIQEQNTVPGMTNRYLAKLASRVFEAFPGSFPKAVAAIESGNPVRPALFALEPPAVRYSTRGEAMNLLVLGGSLGAHSLNETLPQALGLLDKQLPPQVRPQVRHQAGRGKDEATRQRYAEQQVDAEVSAFIDDMASAYAWADLVVCRSGALTVSELAAVGVASLLVPFPHAVDDHQTRNAQFLVDAGAAVLKQQRDLDAQTLADMLQSLAADRARLVQMAEAAHALARPDATSLIADACEEVVR